MAAERTYPVQLLRRQIDTLDEAIVACQKDPGVKEVHRLRTGTRRLEAQLCVVEALPGLPRHKKAADRLRHRLRRLRRAAGEVRDLDVHLARLEDLRAGYQDPTELGDGAAPQGLSRGAEELAAYLEKHRGEAAVDLRKLLAHEREKTARAGKRLLRKLAEASQAALPVAALVQQAQALPNSDGLLTLERNRGLGEDDLHRVRKAAKVARYMTETAPKNASARDAAQHLEALQDMGGRWHDTLELARVARHYLGKKHALTASLAAERDRYLIAYHQALAAEPLGRFPKSSARQPEPRAKAIA